MAVGYFRDVVQDRYGNIVTQYPVLVKNSAGNAAPLYSNKDKTISKTNPIQVNSDGSFDFYADPDTYTIIINDKNFPLEILPQSSEVQQIPVNADRVAVIPAGDLGSTNVQSALQELQGDIDDIELIGQGDATRAGPQTFTGSHIFADSLIIKGDTLYDVRAGSGYDPIASDNAPAIVETIGRASSEGGGVVVLPRGETGITGDIVIPVKVGVRGRGFGRGSTSSASRLVARNASARLKVGNRGDVDHRGGPVISDFELDGGNFAGVNPLYVGLVVERVLERIFVVNTVGGLGMVLEETQNSTFRDIKIVDSDICLAFDYGCGGNIFDGLPYFGKARVSHIVFRQSGPSPLVHNSPRQNRLVSPYIESWISGVSSYVNHIVGRHNRLILPIFSSATATAPITLVRMGSPAGGLPSNDFIVAFPSMSGDGSNTTAFDVGGGANLDLIKPQYLNISSKRIGTGTVTLDGTRAVESYPIFTFDPLNALTTSVMGVANRASYQRLAPNSDYGAITKVGINVGTSSGNICIAAYRNSGEGRNAAPTGGLIASTGSIACPVAGYAEVALAASLNPGDWLGFSVDNNTATFSCLSIAVIASDILKGRAAYQDAAFPLPSIPTPSPGLIRGFYLIGVP